MDIEMNYARLDPGSQLSVSQPQRPTEPLALGTRITDGSVAGLGGLSDSSSAMSSTSSFFSMDVDQDTRGGSPDDQTTGMVVDEDEDEDMPYDLLGRLPNMFRLLDLIGEEGSGGIGKSSLFLKKRKIFNTFHNFPVDKVVIAQESFSRLINTISPGAYTSMTKISFSNLDKLCLRPTGVYGSRAEIVKLLRSLGTVDDELFV
jgi:hypothetical protein